MRLKQQKYIAALLHKYFDKTDGKMYLQYMFGLSYIYLIKDVSKLNSWIGFFFISFYFHDK